MKRNYDQWKLMSPEDEQEERERRQRRYSEEDFGDRADYEYEKKRDMEDEKRHKEYD